MALEKEEQELLADIEIATANLYVFRDSTEKQKWRDILEQALHATSVEKNYAQGRKLVDRVNEVVDALWKRIARWNDLQTRVTTVFLIAIPVELVAIGAYFYFVDIVRYAFYTAMLFGLLGGSLGVALNIGKDLIIEGSNRLQMLRLLLRPFVGVISALVLYTLLQTKIIVVSPNLDSGSVIILLSVFAGFSERFIIKALSDYIPSLLQSPRSS